MNARDDKTILDKLRSTDPKQVDQGFLALYESVFPVIRNFILTNNGQVSDSEDIFQEALIAFFQQLSRGDLELTCSIQTYLYAVCRNLWLKRLRKAKREVPLKDTFEVWNLDENHLKQLVRSERSLLIADLLDKMGDSCRQILQYFYFNKMRMREIAERMAFSSEQGAKNKKSQCLKKLREEAARRGLLPLLD